MKKYLLFLTFLSIAHGLLHAMQHVPALIQAALNGDVATAQHLINRGAAVNVTHASYTPLSIACRLGNLPLFTMLINAGAEVDLKDHTGKIVALECTISNGKLEILPAVLQALNALNQLTPAVKIRALLSAINAGHEEIVTYFIEQWREEIVPELAQNGASIIEAAAAGRPKILKLLIAYKADPHHLNAKGQNTLTEAVKADRLYPSYCLQRSDQYAAAAAAAVQDYLKTLKILINLGVKHSNPINIDGAHLVRVADFSVLTHMAPYMRSNALLTHACINSLAHSPCPYVKQLVAMLGQPELQNYLKKPLKPQKRAYDLLQLVQEHTCKRALTDKAEQVPSSKKRKRTVKLTRECGYTRSANCRQTLLMWASMFGHQEAVELLIQPGVPDFYITAQDAWGRTALMYAVLAERHDIVKLLLTHPAIQKTIHAHSIEGFTALDYAASKGYNALIITLLESNACITSGTIQAASSGGHGLLAAYLLIERLVKQEYNTKLRFIEAAQEL